MYNNIVFSYKPHPPGRKKKKKEKHQETEFDRRFKSFTWFAVRLNDKSDNETTNCLL